MSVLVPPAATPTQLNVSLVLLDFTSNLTPVWLVKTMAVPTATPTLLNVPPVWMATTTSTGSAKTVLDIVLPVPQPLSAQP